MDLIHSVILEVTELTAVRQVDHTTRCLARYAGPCCTSKFWRLARHVEMAPGMTSESDCNLHSYALAGPGCTIFVKRNNIMSSHDGTSRRI
jgi:hypothetical protein